MDHLTGHYIKESYLKFVLGIFRLYPFVKGINFSIYVYMYTYIYSLVFKLLQL